MVRQALVLVGGKASRLRSDGIQVPTTKAFLLLAGRPLLFWNLWALHAAGVQVVLIAGNELAYLHKARAVLDTLPFRFQEVQYYHDFGRGVHGMPYYTRYLLDEQFIFECGHGLSRPEHYRSLVAAKASHNVVFSAFTIHPTNPRLPVVLHGPTVRLAEGSESFQAAFAHPIVADQSYARSLIAHNFDIAKLLKCFLAEGRVRYVVNDLPPEFDTPEEMQLAKQAYEQYLTTTGLL